MMTKRFPGHEGHNVLPLPMKRSSLFEFICGDCLEPFAITFEGFEETPEHEPLPLVYKVAGECPKCDEPVLHWEVCAPGLCEDCEDGR